MHGPMCAICILVLYRESAVVELLVTGPFLFGAYAFRSVLVASVLKQGVLGRAGGYDVFDTGQTPP